MKHRLTIIAICCASFLTSCVDSEPERKPIPPTSSAGNMPWNRPMPGEGSSQFGGMLQRR
ncbi:MAG: hypothetical protein ACOVRB_02540 [Akkermansiaceae bacterium]